MDVAVDEPRKQSESRGLDRRRVAGNLRAVAPSGLGDTTVLDQHHRFACLLSCRRVEHGIAKDGGDHEAMLRLHAIALGKAVEHDVPPLDADGFQHPIGRPGVFGHPPLDCFFGVSLHDP